MRTSRDVLGVVGYEAWAIPRALDFLVRTRERYPFHKLVSHRYSLDQINQAFEDSEWAHGQGKVTRAVVVP